MPKVQTITTNFTGGERSPRMAGRVDLERHNASADLLENVVVLRQGGVTARPCTDFRGEVKDSTKLTRPIAWVASKTLAYVLELGDGVMRVWKDGVLVQQSPGVPFEVATPFSQSQLDLLDWTQQADTMIFASGVQPLKRLRRFGDALWLWDDAPVNPPPVDEQGEIGASNVSISSVSVGGGRTVTLSGGTWTFRQADVGRVIAWGGNGGAASIVGYTSPTQVTAEVFSAFDSSSAPAGTWVLRESPKTDITPNVAGPVGIVITLNSPPGFGAFRPEMVGTIVSLNRGFVRILVVVSDEQVQAIVLKDLASTSSTYQGAWQLLTPIWNSLDGYPKTVTFYQQRLWAANSTRYPQTIWGSEPGEYFEFLPGIDDDSAVYKTIDSDEGNAIEYLTSYSSLVMLTNGGEFDARGGIERPITQLNCQINKRSRWGSDTLRPEEVGPDLIFAERGGTALRAMFKAETDLLDTKDISVYSDHILRSGVRWVSWEQRPEMVCWIGTNDGRLHALTYSSEQAVAAFCSGNALGFVEWGCTVPEGPIDATYLLVRRTINGVSRRYVERLNWAGVTGQDSRRPDTAVSPTVTWSGFDHLALQEVVCVADDVFVGRKTVSAGGVITLDRQASTLSAGLPYTPRVRLSAPEIGTGSGTSQGMNQSTHRVLVRFLETSGCKINGQDIPFRRFDLDNTLDRPPPIFTGIEDVTSIGWDKESPIELSQEQPYPWTILAVVRDFTVNPG